jgi:RHS repeat-associated protein
VPVHRSILRLCVTGLFFLLSCCVTQAQLNNVTADQQTPTPGVGHDYIHGLAETVDPSMGSLSIRINLPMPKGRGPTMPFAFAYDSSGTHFPHSLGTPNAQVGWLTTTGILSQGGWSYSLPLITRGTSSSNDGLGDICTWTSNYVFQDPSGSRHALGLGTANDRPIGSGACGSFGKVNVLAGGDTFFSATPSVIVDRGGTIYNFNPVSLSGSAGSGALQYAPSLIEDRNGNKLTIAGTASSFTITDTVGRSVLSTNGFGVSGNTVTVSGLPSPYVLSWGTANSNFTVGMANPTQTQSCPVAFNPDSETQAVIRSITLPNGQSYTFTYDSDDASIAHPHGLITKITYPTGGWVKYTWKLNLLATHGIFNDGSVLQIMPACPLTYDTPAVATRTVSFDGQNPAIVQTFNYSTVYPPNSDLWSTKQSTVTSQDVIRGGSFETDYTYVPVPIWSSPNDPFPCFCNQLAVENTVIDKDWNGSILKTVTKAWQNQYLLTDETTQLGTGATAPTSSVHYVYYPAAQGFELQEKDEYNFGAGAKGTLARKTVIAYASFPSTPIYPTAPSVFDKPATVIAYDGNGIKFSETDYAYDQSAVGAVSNLPAGTHDETNYPSTSTAPRGNATTVTRKCLQSCVDAITKFTYDETGQTLTKIEPCGNTPCSDMTGSNHTTAYSYADNFDSPPSGNTNAYLTKVTDALGHFATFKYAYADGQLISTTDPNSRVTSYIYADSLRRPTETDFADSGKTIITYNDATYSASTPSPSVTTTKLGSPSPNITTLTAFDGLGHTVRSVLTSDPDCSSGDRTDTTYDGLGRVYKVSNPYCTTGDLTYGLTTYTYDALGRTTQVAHPDGSTILTTYTGSATQVQDEGNGTQRVTRVLQTDGLGRLTQVVEDPATLKFETDYQYDALDNLLCAAQKGTNSGTFTNCASTPATWRPRTFAYDSLSRIVCASNPENSSAACPATATGTYTPGTTGYVYDANGNLASKTSPAPNQTGTSTVTATYQYDALNRRTQKSYSDGVTLPALFGYDQTLITMGSQQFNISNSIGRMSWNCILHPGSPPSCAGSMTANSYDPMGRLAELWQENPVNSNNIFVSYGYDLIGDETNRSLNNLNYLATFSGAARLLTFSQTSYTNATNPPNLLTSPHYNALGQLSLATFANGLSESWNYDNRGRLKGAAVGTNCGNETGTCSGSSVYSFSLGFAPNSNVMTANDSINGNWAYSYDQLNRLWSASSTSGQSCKGLSWAYDAWGNRTDQNLTAGTCGMFHAIVGANNRLGSPYQYDAAGNMTYDGVHHYTYDPENRIISVDNGATTYTYDALGRRVAKSTGGSTTDFIYDREEHVILTNPATPTMIEMYAAGLHLGTYVLNAAQTATVLYYDHADWLGTERARADLSGNACEKISSLPFGDGQTITGTCGDISPRHFTGKERDTESGLDNFGARYFGSSTGRFQSPDPGNAGAMNDDPQSWNAYAYARNNPLLYGDPDGQKYQICDNTGHCSEISDKDFNDNFLNAKNVQLNGNQISIQGANGNFNNEGTFKRTSFDDLDAQGNAFFNEMSARREPSLNAIKVFAVRSVTDSLGGAVVGKVIGAGVEAIQGAKAASEAAAETTELVTQAATTVGNKGAVASSEAAAVQTAEEWVGIGSRPIYENGQIIGKISADETRVYRITSIGKAEPYINLIRRTPDNYQAGNLHVSW